MRWEDRFSMLIIWGSTLFLRWSSVKWDARIFWILSWTIHFIQPPLSWRAHCLGHEWCPIQGKCDERTIDRWGVRTFRKSASHLARWVPLLRQVVLVAVGFRMRYYCPKITRRGKTTGGGCPPDAANEEQIDAELAYATTRQTILNKAWVFP